MLHSKHYDVVYPDAVAGIETVEIRREIKSFAKTVSDVGGSTDVVRVVRPTSVTYDYRTVARD